MPQVTVDGHPPVFFGLWYVVLFLQFVWDGIQDILNREPPPPPPPPEPEPEPADDTAADAPPAEEPTS